MICRDLCREGKIIREKGECPEERGKVKLINRIAGLANEYSFIISRSDSVIKDEQAFYCIRSESVAGRLDSLRRQIIGILNELDRTKLPSSKGGTVEGFAERIGRLTDDGSIPQRISIFMRMLGALRNAVVYRDCILEKEDMSLVDSALEIILSWWRERKAS